MLPNYPVGRLCIRNVQLVIPVWFECNISETTSLGAAQEEWQQRPHTLYLVVVVYPGLCLTLPFYSHFLFLSVLHPKVSSPRARMRFGRGCVFMQASFTAVCVLAGA